MSGLRLITNLDFVIPDEAIAEIRDRRAEVYVTSTLLKLLGFCLPGPGSRYRLTGVTTVRDGGCEQSEPGPKYGLFLLCPCAAKV